jgi:uncharacterized protein YbcI
MSNLVPSIAQQLAQAARTLQEQQTGRIPTSVTVVLSKDTLVVTLHGALSPAEQQLARTPQGAADLQEYYRKVFHNSVPSLRKQIKRITGREMPEGAAEFDPGTGCIVHAFTTGNEVQVFMLAETYARDGAAAAV